MLPALLFGSLTAFVPITTPPGWGVFAPLPIATAKLPSALAPAPRATELVPAALALHPSASALAPGAEAAVPAAQLSAITATPPLSEIVPAECAESDRLPSTPAVTSDEAAAETFVRDLLLPRPFAVSCTAVHVPVDSFQTDLYALFILQSLIIPLFPWPDLVEPRRQFSSGLRLLATMRVDLPGEALLFQRRAHRNVGAPVICTSMVVGVCRPSAAPLACEGASAAQPRYRFIRTAHLASTWNCSSETVTDRSLRTQTCSRTRESTFSRREKW